MTAKALAFVSYGMGGAPIDPAMGERELVVRLKAIGVDTADSPYQWSDVRTIANAILAAPKGTLIIVGGDSLGDNEAPYIAQALKGKRAINYLFGFQRSTWGVQASVPNNVLVARSINNPGVLGFVWTLGMGSDPWELDPGNTVTKLTNTTIRAPHPDDWGDAQDLVFADIKRIVGA